MTSAKNILITGSNSGLGKHCLEYFGGVGFNRQTNYDEVLALGNKHPFQMIIHCAFNTKPDVATPDLNSYLSDTLELTQKLIQIPHHQFVFISTVDVYPKNDAPHVEEEEINLKNVNNIYGLSKLICECLVLNKAKNALVLRPTALLGQYAKKNSLMRILTQPEVSLSLSRDSTFNYVLHSDISRFIEIASQKQVTGVYNLSSSSNITLGEVADKFKVNPLFGNYKYETGKIENRKVASLAKEFNKSSLDNIKLFVGA